MNSPSRHRVKGKERAQRSAWHQFFDFGIKQALSCIFPLAIFIALGLTQVVHVPSVQRYDLILLICIGVQIAMVALKFETWDELKVICLFHAFGLVLEIFKVSHGSWAYPEPALTKVCGVPLYSGFMYASIASYMCQAWRRLDLILEGWPRLSVITPIAVAIYLNFFTEHFIGDYRWALAAVAIFVLRRCRVRYTVAGVDRWMPIVLSFACIGFFVWVAENISTSLHGWVYPNQVTAWQFVHTSKMSSWSLLVIISFIGIAELKRTKEKLQAAELVAAEVEGRGLPVRKG